MVNKKSLLVLTIMLSAFMLFADISIGAFDTSNTTNSVPFASNFGYSYVQNIYNQAQIGNSGDITALKFYCSIDNADAFTEVNDITVFLGHTQMDNFAADADVIPMSDLTQVFQGTISEADFDGVLGDFGYLNITLSTPFSYNNTDNLVIAIDEDADGYSFGMDFVFTEQSENIAGGERDDTTNFTPDEIETYEFVTNKLADIVIVGIENTSLPGVAYNPSPENEEVVQSTSVDFSWSAQNSETYDLYIDDALVAEDLTENTFSYEQAFAYESAHTWYVVSENANGSTTGETWSFTIREDPTLEPPVTENFDGTFPATDWIQAQAILSDETTLDIGSSSWHQDSADDMSSDAASLNIWGTSCDEWLITPPINFTADSYQITFDLTFTEYNSTTAGTFGEDDRFCVLVSDAEGNSITEANVLAEWNATNPIPAEGLTANIEVTNYSGAVRIGFYGESTVSNEDNDIYIDNLAVMEMTDEPIFNVNTTEIDFGTQIEGIASESSTVVISNLGGGSFNIESVELTGEQAENFVLDLGENTFPAVIEDNSLTFDVQVLASVLGEISATIQITDNLRQVHEIALSANVLLDDDNNTPETATEITVPADSLEYNIEYDGDYDWYKFDLVANDSITVFTERINDSAIDLEAWLYGPYATAEAVVDTVFVESDDDSNGNLQPYFGYDVTETGTYYLRLAYFADDPDDRADTGEYALTILSEGTGEETGTLAGTVLAEDDSAIEGAIITFDDYQTTTDADGNYLIENISVATYEVTCEAEGYQTQTQSIEISADTETNLDFTLVEEANEDVDAPINITANSFMNDNAEIRWEMPLEGEFIHWDNGDNYSGVGTDSEVIFDVASRWEPADISDYDGQFLNAVRFFPAYDCNYTIKVWTGGSFNGTDFNEGTLVLEQEVVEPTIDEWNIVFLNNPIEIDASEELWFGYEVDTTGGFPAGTDDSTVIENKGSLINFQGAWSNAYDLAETLTNNWNLQALVHTESRDVRFTRNERAIDGFEIYRDGTMIAEIDSPQTMIYHDMDLAEGTYEYFVKATNGNNTSEASETVSVTIEEVANLAVPFNLTATQNNSNLDLSWEMRNADDVLSYSGPEVANSIGYGAAGTFDVAVRYTADDIAPYAGLYLDTITFATMADSCEYSVQVWKDGSEVEDGVFDSGYLVADQMAENVVVSAMNTVELENPVLIEAGMEFWIVVHYEAQTGYPIGLDNGPAVTNKGCLMKTGADWTDITAATDNQFNANLVLSATLTEETDTRNNGIDAIDYQAVASSNPANLLANNDLFRKEVRLNDRNSRALTGYKIYEDGSELTTIDNPATMNYTIENIASGSYSFAVTALYDEGESAQSNIANITGSEEESDNLVPTRLVGNYPNPFNPTTSIRFSVENPENATLEIYNVLGQKIKTFDIQKKGEQTIEWQCKDQKGYKVSSGVYFYKLKTTMKSETKKMLLLK